MCAGEAKAQARLHECAGSPGPPLLANGIRTKVSLIRSNVNLHTTFS